MKFIRTACQITLRSDQLRYKFRTFRVEPVGTIFFILYIPYRFRVCQAVHKRPRTSGSVSIGLRADLIKDNQKKAKFSLAVLGTFIFVPGSCSNGRAGSRRDAFTPCEACHGVLNRYHALALVHGAGIPRIAGSCTPCKMSCTSSRLSSPLLSLCGRPKLVKSSSQHGHRSRSPTLG